MQLPISFLKFKKISLELVIPLKMFCNYYSPAALSKKIVVTKNSRLALQGEVTEGGEGGRKSLHMYVHIGVWARESTIAAFLCV